MKIKSGRTESYFATLTNNATDLRVLKQLRARIKEQNKTSSVKKRVVIRGRVAKEKAIVHSYYGPSKVLSYDWAGNIVGGIANAKFIDVYIYNR